MTEKVTILIADDDEYIIDSIKDFLEDDYNIITTNNGEEVVNYINKTPTEKIDLLLLDIMMPVLDGYEVLKRIKEMDIPVLILSAKADVVSKIKGLSLGAWGYLSKPFHIEELNAQINTLVKLGRTIKELKKSKEMEKRGKFLAQQIADKLEKELVKTKTRTQKPEKDIAKVKLNKLQYSQEDVFDDVVNSQKSICNQIDTRIKELRTSMDFFLEADQSSGIQEQFSDINTLIEELFALSDSLSFFRI